MRKMGSPLLVIRAFVVGMLLVAVSLSWAQGQSKVVVVKAVKHAVAPPLSQMESIPAPSGQMSSLDEDDNDRLVIHGPRATSPAPDSALQGSDQTTLSPALATLSTNSGLNILGVGNGFPGYAIQAIVPDSDVAVGPTQVVQFVDRSFAVFDKSTGAVALGPITGATLWQALGAPCYISGTDYSDEIVQFDKLANVWVMLMPVWNSPNQLCVAVSTTADAANTTWNLYDFPIPRGMMADYPKLAVWPDAYYVTYNQGDDLVFVGAAGCALDRSAMLTGAVAPAMQCFDHTSASYGVLLPADLDGATPPPTGTAEYFLNFDGNDASLDLWQFHVNWTTPSSSWFGTSSTNSSPTNIPVAAFTEACGETIAELNYTTGACIPQAGTTQMLDSYGDRLMYRLAYRNYGTYQALVANHTVTIGTSSSQTGIRWYELQNTGSSFGVYQQGTYAPDSSYRWMGSVAMDGAGDIAMGYSVSNGSMSPSIRYTGRLATDPLGTMESEIDILSEAGITTSSRTNTYRWGDYSAMAIDPSDDCTFWYTTQYEKGGTTNWSTRIASFNFPSCTQSTTLTVNDLGQGTVTSTDGQISCTNGSGTCSAVYTTGSSVTLNASAASGWTFSGWSGSCSGANPCQVVMSSSLSVTATFKANTSWAIVNKASKGGVTSLTIPATGSGHLIAVALIFNGSTSVASLSDNANGGSNTYVSAGARSTSGVWSTEIWYAVNSKSGATVVTPTLAGTSPQVQIAVWEVSGLSASTPDATNTSSGSLTLNNTPGAAVTTKQAGDFIVSIMLANSSDLSAISSGNAFTDDFGSDGNGWAHLTSTSATAGTYQASWYTASPSGQYCASTVALHQ
jgi:hypothetical protein